MSTATVPESSVEQINGNKRDRRHKNADELGPQGVNVVVVHPGLTRTEKTPQTLAAMAAAHGVSAEEVERRAAADISIGRIVTAAEVADVIAFLASPKSVALNGDPVLAGGGVRGPIHY